MSDGFAGTSSGSGFGGSINASYGNNTYVNINIRFPRPPEGIHPKKIGMLFSCSYFFYTK